MSDTSSWAIWRDIPPARLDHFDTWSKEIFSGIESQIRYDIFRQSFRLPRRSTMSRSQPRGDV